MQLCKYHTFTNKRFPQFIPRKHRGKLSVNQLSKVLHSNIEAEEGVAYHA